MNLAPLQISEADAKAALAEYERQLAAERTTEDEAIAQAYRAAARGHQVIRLTEAVRIGGYVDDGHPRIAVCRADATKCWVTSNGRDIVYSSDEWMDNRGALVGRTTVRVPGVNEGGWLRRASTVVPLIPPRHRPRPRRLRHCHVLWEVESWTPEPPRDPALLRHIRGDLWAVLAVWDLTDIERAVLAQRAS
jgi:hypothetical protein